MNDAIEALWIAACGHAAENLMEEITDDDEAVTDPMARLVAVTEYLKETS